MPEIAIIMMMVLQMFLISLGVWQFRQPTKWLQIAGGFNILIGLVGAACNLTKLFQG